MNNAEWRKAPDFAEIAEALEVNTTDIMAALASPGGRFLALYTPKPDDEDPSIFSAQLERDADGILVASPPRFVESSSTFAKQMKEQIGRRLEEEFGPPNDDFGMGLGEIDGGGE